MNGEGCCDWVYIKLLFITKKPLVINYHNSKQRSKNEQQNKNYFQSKLFHCFSVSCVIKQYYNYTTIMSQYFLLKIILFTVEVNDCLQRWIFFIYSLIYFQRQYNTWHSSIASLLHSVSNTYTAFNNHNQVCNFLGANITLG